jgi:tRNA threonylcarbamoyladenosine biosynthesis protein TsaE
LNRFHYANLPILPILSIAGFATTMQLKFHLFIFAYRSTDMERIFSLTEIEEVAREWWSETGGYTVFAFHGQMGAGKTTFIHYLCQAKAVKDTIGSPTFSLVNEYQTGEEDAQTIYHIDLYRLKDETEAIQAGIEECLYSGAICFVEWPEKAPGILPPGTLHTYIEVLDATMRRLKIEIPAGN